MAQPLILDLTSAQREELESIRAKHSLPYMRERASALLKVADGTVARQVALTGLNQVRDPDSVYSWIRRYQARGVAGLYVQAGRGRKAAFSPSVPDQGGGPGGDSGGGAS